MLKSVSITNFKSYQNAELPLGPLTVLIGANASGKSNAIEAIRFLSWIAQGNRLGAMRYAVYEGTQAVRGTVLSLGYKGSSIFELGGSTDDKDWNKFNIQLMVGEDEELHILNEKITSPASAVPLYEVVGHSQGAGSDLRVAYNNFARGGKKPQVSCADHMAILQQLQSAARFQVGDRSAQSRIPELCARIQSSLTSIVFLDPQPALMRGYSFASEHRLKPDGSNLSGVLHGLCAENKGAARGKSAVLQFIKSLPEQDISGIDFITTPRNEVMIELVETFGSVEKKFDATLLSDGTLRVLSMAAAILSAPEKSLVVIEEIDNGIHPSRANAILSGISSIAKERNLSVLISSHNPALLDALPASAIPETVFCYRDSADGSSRLVKLEALPDYPELVAQGTLGHLLSKGIIDKFVKSQQDSAIKRKRALDWLANLPNVES